MNGIWAVSSLNIYLHCFCQKDIFKTFFFLEEEGGGGDWGDVRANMFISAQEVDKQN